METNPEFVIESNIPVPPAHGRGRVPKYPFGKMQVGESFFLTAVNGDAKATTRLRTAAAAYGKRCNFSFVVRNVEGGARCWRIK